MYSYKNVFRLFSLVWVFAMGITLLVYYQSLPSKSNHQASPVSSSGETENIVAVTIPVSPTPALSLNTIFDEVLLEADQQSWKLVVGGDYNPGRHVNVVATRQHSFDSLLINLEDIFETGDIAMVNLEGALVHNCPLMSEGMQFCGSVKHARGLQSLGIDMVSLANNHSLNFGQNGLDETKAVLAEHGLRSAGFDETVVMQVANQEKVAIIGIDATLKPRDPQEIGTLIAAAAQHVQIIIPYFHWGNEYTHDPSPHQRDLAHVAIEAGATLVLGSHPHWVQAVEIYNHKLIVYSHGNLVFDQFWSEKTRQGIVGEYSFLAENLIDARFIPIYIEQGYQPKVLTNEAARIIINQMKDSSEKLVRYE